MSHLKLVLLLYSVRVQLPTGYYFCLYRYRTYERHVIMYSAQKSTGRKKNKVGIQRMGEGRMSAVRNKIPSIITATVQACVRTYIPHAVWGYS